MVSAYFSLVHGECLSIAVKSVFENNYGQFVPKAQRVRKECCEDMSHSSIVHTICYRLIKAQYTYVALIPWEFVLLEV